MVRRSWQAVAAASLSLCAAALAQTAPATQPAGSVVASSQLRWACDALLNEALTRRYGVAWPIDSQNSADAGKGAKQGSNQPIRVDFSPRATPAAGLVLQLAGVALNEPRYRDAAMQVARGLAVAQDASGRVPGVAMFAAGSASSRDGSASVPDRAPTRAALGLWLAILQSQTDRDPRIAGAAARAATWLLRQQGSNGVWSISIKTEEGPERCIRLDQPDYRDNTLAILLVGRVTPEFRFTASADRGVAQLMKMRMQGPHPLWGTLYSAEGIIKTGGPDIPDGVNLLATRYAMQTLLAYALVTGNADAMSTLDEIAKPIESLRSQSGAWPPTYVEGQRTDDLQGSAFTAPQSGTFGLPETLKAAAGARVLTPARYVGLLKAGFGLEQQLALMLTGLSDLPMAADFPVGAAEVKPYLAAHPELGTDLEHAGVPTDLGGRVDLAYRWLVRTKLDAKTTPRPAATLSVKSDKSTP